MPKSTRPERPWGYELEEWDEALDKLDPTLAHQIRTAATRAGLQAHDPAARMIAEMWVAVAALRSEREQLRQELSEIRQGLRDDKQHLLAVIVLVSVHFLVFVGWLLA